MMLSVTLTPEVQQLLEALGFKHTHHPACWCDIGSAESGPQPQGNDAYDEWSKDGLSLYVQYGVIWEVEEEHIPPHTPL